MPDQGGYTIEASDIIVAKRADRALPALTEEAGIPRHAEVWWPDGAAAPIKPAGDLPAYAQYFAGSGCLNRPAFGDGTMHFYQLVWKKLTGDGAK